MSDTVEEIASDRVAAQLHSVRYGRSLRVLADTASTNDDARADAYDGAPDGHVVVADAQSRGRGSHGRVWSSTAGTDLYLSIVARPALPLSELPRVTLAVGLGVSDAVDALLASDKVDPSHVKWPNDVWLRGKKCAGVLVEASTIGDAAGPVIIGIGLNVNRVEFPDDIAELATSLRAARPSRARLDRAAVLATLLTRVEQRVDELVRDGLGAIASAIDERLALKGCAVRCDGVEGTLVGLSRTGAVRIATSAGMQELIAGRLLPIP